MRLNWRFIKLQFKQSRDANIYQRVNLRISCLFRTNKRTQRQAEWETTWTSRQTETHISRSTRCSSTGTTSKPPPTTNRTRLTRWAKMNSTLTVYEITLCSPTYIVFIVSQCSQTHATVGNLYRVYKLTLWLPTNIVYPIIRDCSHVFTNSHRVHDLFE